MTRQRRLRLLAVLATAPVVAASTALADATATRALPLGSIVHTGQGDPTAPAGFGSRGFTVSCPGVGEDARGFLATAKAIGRPRGVVMLFSGGGGTSYWSRGGVGTSFVHTLRRDGFTVVQVRWVRGWLTAPTGEQTGPARLACRTATVVKSVHERIVKPLRLSRSRVGRCGFCISGNSGGASQVSYVLSHYGLDTILDAVVPTGGPPHAALAKGCIGEAGYAYRPESASTIDRSYGFARGDGPCARRDASFASRWRQDAVDTGGTDYVHPRTRVVFVFGTEDRSGAVELARDYADRLRAAGSPRVHVRNVAGMPHAIARSAAGLAVLRQILRG